MKKIGLITYYNGNYGSILQCLASKLYFENNGVICDVIYEKEEGLDKYKYYFYKFFQLFKASLSHPSFIFNYYHLKKKKYFSKLTNDARNKLSFFSNTVLQPRGYSYSFLKKYSNTNIYDYFVCGSDQIWNFDIGMVNRMYVLSFAPNDKKIALAPSFGTNEISKYCRRTFKNKVTKFKKISVREKKGQEILYNLLGYNVDILPDPVLLLDQSKWVELSNNGILLNEPYILIHFLDVPSKIFVDYIKTNFSNYKLIVFSYPHNEFNDLKNVELFSGNPYDYLSLIKNARYVFTDSFHTSLFSLIFNSNFYVFSRNYELVSSQESRLNNLLNTFNLDYRFIDNEEKIIISDIDFNSVNCKMDELRKKIREYVAFIINSDKKEKIKTNDCCGCEICYNSCPKNAIKIDYNNFGYLIPKIDLSMCINCNACFNICNNSYDFDFSYKKQAYVAYNSNELLRKNSASGGIFSSLANKFIENGGIVYGAKMELNGEKTRVICSRATTFDDLLPLLKSKYVQCENGDAFSFVKKDLLDGKKVLFSGTSCQIDALRKFLKKSYDNLFTIDLICHGVPGTLFFSNYIVYLEKKYKGKIVDFQFRKKQDNKIDYVILLKIEKNGKNESVEIPYNKSSYYRMFLSGESYRESCYNCKFASINKVSDITIGDYFEIKNDYPDLIKNDSKIIKNGCSAVIINTNKGNELFINYGIDIVKYYVDIIKVQASHEQLCHPMTYSKQRYKLFGFYQKNGFVALQRYYRRKDLIFYLPKKIRKLLKK